MQFETWIEKFRNREKKTTISRTAVRRFILRSMLRSNPYRPIELPSCLTLPLVDLVFSILRSLFSCRGTATTEIERDHASRMLLNIRGSLLQDFPGTIFNLVDVRKGDEKQPKEETTREIDREREREQAKVERICIRKKNKGWQRKKESGKTRKRKRPRQFGPYGMLITAWLGYFYVSPSGDIKNPALDFKYIYIY